MDEPSQRSALLTALTTEHFVLQTANSSTYAEASSRSSLYVMALSSSLVAMGFLANSAETLMPFAATVLPAIFLLGIFTVARLVETGLESMHYLVEIARIREFYRTLSAEAEQRFAPDRGRWPEAKTPALRLGPMLAFFGTTASMIAVINNLVAGAAVALLMHAISPSVSRSMDVAAGIVCALALTVAFYFYQRWRFTEFDGASPVNDQ